MRMPCCKRWLCQCQSSAALTDRIHSLAASLIKSALNGCLKALTSLLLNCWNA